MVQYVELKRSVGMDSNMYGAIRNREREHVKEHFESLLVQGEKVQIQAMRLVDGTEFFIQNSANNITVKDGKVKNAKEIIKSIASVFDDKLTEISSSIKALENVIREMEEVSAELKGYTLENFAQELDDQIEAVQAYIPRLKAFEEPVNKARAEAVERTKKKIVHMHKNEFINKLK